MLNKQTHLSKMEKQLHSPTTKLEKSTRAKTHTLPSNNPAPVASEELNPDDNVASNNKLVTGNMRLKAKEIESNIVEESLLPEGSKQNKETLLAPKTPRKRSSAKHKEPVDQQRKTSKKRKHKTKNTNDHSSVQRALGTPIIYTPLSDITKVNTPYNIQVRIIKLWCGKLYGRKFPVSMVFIVRDEEGVSLEVIVPDAYCKKYKAILQEGLTYSITNVTLGVSNKPYKTLRKTRQLFLDATTRIAPLEDNGLIDTHTYYCETLNQIPELSKRPTLLFDIVAYVVDMTFPIGKSLQHQASTSLVELSVIDKTCYEHPTTFTVWEDVFQQYPAELTHGFVRPFVIIARGVHSKLFMSKPIIESTGFTQILFNDESISQARKLYRWVQQEYTQMRIEQQNLTLTESSDMNKVTIKELIDRTYKQPTKDQECTYIVVADLVFVFVQDEMTYESCPECKTRAPDGTTTDYKCAGCNKMQPPPISRLKIKATIEDATDAINVVLFHRQAQTILHEPVETIKDLKKQRNSTALLNEKIDKYLNMPYKFTIKVSEANFRYIQTNGYTVTHVERIGKGYLAAEEAAPTLICPPDDSTTESSDTNDQSEDSDATDTATAENDRPE